MGFDNSDIKFICDDNLGKLARYLRVGGFDTIYEKSISKSRLIQISLDENRYILTRARRLIERTLVRKFFLINHDLWSDQLRDVINHFNLQYSSKRMFQRCLEDNAVIVPVNKTVIKNLVWQYTYENHDSFRQCPVCKRIFWTGSHITVMKQRLQKDGIVILK
jgi:uncharacterized protein with PIN domain